MKLTKRQWLGRIVKARARHNRGAGLASDVRNIFYGLLTGGLFMDLINRYTSIQVPIWALIVITLVLEVVYYFIGWVDERLGFWKIELDYMPRNMNPWNREVLKRIKSIEDKLNERV